MFAFILRRSGVMLLTVLALTFIVFWLTNLPTQPGKACEIGLPSG